VRLGHLLRLIDRVHHRPHRASGEQQYDALGERARAIFSSRGRARNTVPVI